MLGNNQKVRNKKPRSKGEAQLQGRMVEHKKYNNYTATADLQASSGRYENGLELYKSGWVSYHLPGNQQSIARTRWITPS